ncbi:alpha/beta hydrolase family esterase [Streptomyces sp. NPDC086787]|uniref:alpha/beta hydrolase family esterase n=1 Tax=Streptomyces sp. NPDC086787 TaxID=3365759 RepID=UPI003828C543
MSPLTPHTSRPRGRTLFRARTVFSWSVALALGVAVAGCGSASERTSPPTSVSSAPQAGGTAVADTRGQLRVGDSVREYLLHRPGAHAGTARPLVIAFHGRGSSAEGLREQSRLNAAAEARGMLVAYPEGLRKAWGAGTAASERRPDPDADVRFTQSLIDELVDTGQADPRRVYVVGFSNGGSMALRVAAQRPTLVAGAASVSGELPTGAAAVTPTGAVPVMIVYGENDPVRPLAGLPSPGPAPAGEEPITPTMSARASAEAFARVGGADSPATRAAAGYDRTVWGDEGSRGTVELLVMHGGGHTWPGSGITPPQGFGRTSTALNATSTILDFFAAHQR